MLYDVRAKDVGIILRNIKHAYPPIYASIFQAHSSSQGFPPNLCLHFSSPPCVPHVLSASPSTILSLITFGETSISINSPLCYFFQTSFFLMMLHISEFYFEVYRRSTVVKVLCYKSEGRWFDPSWCQWIFH